MASESITSIKDRVSNLAKWLLPPAWREAISRLRRLGVLSYRKLATVLSLNLLKVFVEAFGLAMLFPLLQFVEAKQDIRALTANSQVWRAIESTFAFVGLNVTLAALSSIVLAIVLLRQVVVYQSVVQMERLKEDVTLKIRNKVFQGILSSSADYIRELRSGHFVNLVNNEAQSCGSVVRNFVTVVTVLFSFATYGSLLLVSSPIATIALGVVGIGLTVLTKRLTALAKEIGRQTIRAQRDYTQFASERFRAWRLLKLSGSIDREEGLNNQRAGRIAHLSVRRTEVAATIGLIVTPLTMAVALVALNLIVGFSSISLSAITVYFVILLRLMPILQQYLNTRQAFANMEPFLRNVENTWLEAIASREINAGNRKLEALERDIVFSGVNYSYAGRNDPALVNFSAKLPAKQLTAIVGPSGAGKSTLVDLIPRIIAPDDGDIFIDGVPVEEFDLQSLRSEIAFVSQHPLLLDDTVSANIRYSRPSAVDNEVMQAATLARANDFIASMPQGAATNLGEDGAELSGGQRQRVALARAFLAQSRLLIFDEPTSALDYESEEAIRAVLRELRDAGKKTIIVIAHRPSTVRDADHVIIVRNGQLVCQGTPAELLEVDSWYAAMMLEGDDADSSMDSAERKPVVASEPAP